MRSWIRSGLIALLTALLPASAAQATALVELVDGGTRAVWELNGSDQGLVDWFVGGTDHMERQWFWLGAGGDPEFAVDELTRTGFVATDTDGDGDDDSLFLRYEEEGILQVDLSFHLEDGGVLGPAGEQIAQASLAEFFTITNLSDEPLPFFRFFAYSDLELAGTPRDDVILSGGFGGLNSSFRVFQAENFFLFEPGGNTNRAVIYESTINPTLLPLLFFGAAYTFDDNGLLLNLLDDGNPDLGFCPPAPFTLNVNACTGLNNGDFAHVLAIGGGGLFTNSANFNLNLPPGSTFHLGRLQNILAFVPEPGSALLLGLGSLAALALARRS